MNIRNPKEIRTNDDLDQDCKTLDLDHFSTPIQRVAGCMLIRTKEKSTLKYKCTSWPFEFSKKQENVQNPKQTRTDDLDLDCKTLDLHVVGIFMTMLSTKEPCPMLERFLPPRPCRPYGVGPRGRHKKIWYFNVYSVLEGILRK